MTKSAATAQKQERQQRYVVVPKQLCVAMRAARPSSQCLTGLKPQHQNIKKAAYTKAEQKKKKCGHNSFSVPQLKSLPIAQPPNTMGHEILVGGTGNLVIVLNRLNDITLGRLAHALLLKVCGAQIKIMRH